VLVRMRVIPLYIVSKIMSGCRRFGNRNRVDLDVQSLFVNTIFAQRKEAYQFNPVHLEKHPDTTYTIA